MKRVTTHAKVLTTALALAIFCLAAPAIAEEAAGPSVSIESQNKFSEAGKFYRAALALNVPIPRTNETLGLSCINFTDFSADYTETYCGPSINLSNVTNLDLILTLGAGAEMVGGESFFRSAGSIFVAKKNFTAFGLVEGGGSGADGILWAAKLTYSWAFYNNQATFTAGIFSQRYDGEGPYISVGPDLLQVYFAPLFNTELHFRHDVPAKDCFALLAGVVFTPSNF